MEFKKTIFSLVLLLLGLGGLHAQESILPAGGEAIGTGGTSSFSVGQIVYTTNIGTNGSITQGVQQQYIIFITTGVNETSIDLEVSVYPNPTTDYLTLKVENPEGLSFQLFDLQGVMVEYNKVRENSTTVEMKNLPSAIYFLKVIQKNQVVKSFKIIKN